MEYEMLTEAMYFYVGDLKSLRFWSIVFIHPAITLLKGRIGHVFACLKLSLSDRRLL